MKQYYEDAISIMPYRHVKCVIKSANKRLVFCNEGPSVIVTDPGHFMQEYRAWLTERTFPSNHPKR
jgi:hypothetical protein